MYKVFEEKWNGGYIPNVKVVKEFEGSSQGLQDAYDYLINMSDPLALRKTWKLVSIGGYDDGVHVYYTEVSFEYENINTGDIIAYRYYIRDTDE